MVYPLLHEGGRNAGLAKMGEKMTLTRIALLLLIDLCAARGMDTGEAREIMERNQHAN